MRLGILALSFATLISGEVFAAFPLPDGFHRTDPIMDRSEPSGVYFAHDGRVFVTEKSGLIWVYQNLVDTDPQIFADISANVHDYWDRGLLGFALDPRFPEQPYVYVQYAFNGGLFADLPPRWPEFDCPDPTGNNAGCVISGRVSRLTVHGGVADNELVLVEDWYQQYPSHSIGTIKFGPDGYLYAGGGDGASFNFHDLGQSGNPDWPDERSPPNEGGSLRSLGLEDEAAYIDQVWLSGSVSRIDPATGAGAPGNPLAGGTNTPNAQRIIAYGFRNPFRFTFHPDSGQIWLGDVGENVWEEINIIPALPESGATLQNYGWPCFEGRGHHDGFDVPICTNLYQDGGGRTPVTAPWYAYNHGAGPDVGNGSDITGLAFYEGDLYPPEYRDSLFFADNSRTVIFNIPYVDANSDGIPDPPADDNATPFYDGVFATAVQLTTGPGGDIFFANLLVGRISRLSYCDGCTNLAPSAAIALDTGSTADGAPRTITFTAANSVDPDQDEALTYDWDLDGDGVFGDASGVTAFRFYADEGSYRVAVRVTDEAGASDTQSMLVTVVGSIGIADVGITFDDHATITAPGEIVDYALTVTNHGTDDVLGEHVATTVSPMLRNVLWVCDATGGGVCAGQGDGNVDTSVDLPPGAFVTFYVLGIVTANASGTLDSGAAITVAPGYEDPNLTDNTASDSDVIVTDRLFANGFEG